MELTAGFLALMPIVSMSSPMIPVTPYFHWRVCSMPTTKTAERRARTGTMVPPSGFAGGTVRGGCCGGAGKGSKTSANSTKLATNST